MNSRERVRRAIAFRTPDRVPYFHRFLDATRMRYPELVDNIQARYPGDRADGGWGGPCISMPAHETDDAVQSTDEWGCVRFTGVEGLTGIAKGNPISDWQAFSRHRWPDYRRLGDWERLPEVLRQHPDKYHDARGPSCDVFQRMQALRGYANLMIDLAEGRSEVYELRDRVVDTMLVAVDRWLQTDVDTIGFSDDWGSQRSLMINPAMWRAVFRPAYARLFEPVKQAGKFIQFHSDGMVLPIISDLVELGVNILNVQHNLIGLDRLSQFRGRVCFLTYMDIQGVLPYGTPADVRQHVADVFEALGTPAGGVIGYAPLTPDVPPENVEALYAAYIEFGVMD